MSHYNSNEMSDEERVGAAQTGGKADPTTAFQSLHTKSPLEQLMEGEEGETMTKDQRRVQTMSKLMHYFFEDGQPQNPMMAMRRVYSLAKSFFPEVIQGMSLHQLAVIFEEDNLKSARARWHARIDKTVIKKIESGGAVAHAKFQKSATASRTYSEAQKGNQNRKNKK